MTGRTEDTQFVGRVRVHAIDLTSFRPGAWPTAADADTETARLIAEGELGSALGRLSGATTGIPGL